MSKKAGVSGTVAGVVIGAAIGVATGYYARYYQEPDIAQAIEQIRAESANPAAAGASSAALPPPPLTDGPAPADSARPAASPGQSPGQAPGGGGQARSGFAVARIVRTLALIENAKSHGLTADQAAKLKPILESLSSDEQLTEEEAAKALADIEAVLKDDQKDFMAAANPGRGGGGGAAPSSGSGAAPGGGGGGAPDPEKPFENERNKKALEDLLSSVKSKS